MCVGGARGGFCDFLDFRMISRGSQGRPFSWDSANGHKFLCELRGAWFCMIFKWSLYDFQMISIWFLYDFYMISIWFLHDFYVTFYIISIWFPWDLHMVSMCFLYIFYMVSDDFYIRKPWKSTKISDHPLGINIRKPWKSI